MGGAPNGWRRDSQWKTLTVQKCDMKQILHIFRTFQSMNYIWKWFGPVGLLDNDQKIDLCIFPKDIKRLVLSYCETCSVCQGLLNNECRDVSDCGKVKYCTHECYRIHWTAHKKQCQICLLRSVVGRNQKVGNVFT
jgi:hypothetical protein